MDSGDSGSTASSTVESPPHLTPFESISCEQQILSKFPLFPQCEYFELKNVHTVYQSKAPCSSFAAIPSILVL